MIPSSRGWPATSANREQCFCSFPPARTSGVAIFGCAIAVRPAPSKINATSLPRAWRSEEHTYELQSLMRISYAVLCLKKNKNRTIGKNDRMTSCKFNYVIHQELYSAKGTHQSKHISTHKR